MRAKDIRKSAWDSLSGKWGSCILAFIIFDIISGALAGLSYVVVGAIALLIVSGPLMLGYTKIYLNVARGKDADLGMLFNGFNDFGRSLVLYITNQIFIALWTMLLIIPGIIKSLAYSMSYYILLDDPNISAGDARKKSIAMMKGNKWRLFCLQLSFIGWFLLCIITFGILIFWVGPYMEVAKAKFYLSLLPEEERKDSVVGDDGIVIDNDVLPFGDDVNSKNSRDEGNKDSKDDVKNDFGFEIDDDFKF